MFETRFKAAMGAGIVAAGLGLLAFTDAREINPPAVRAPIQVPEGDLGQFPQRAAAQPEPIIPCDVGEPAGKIVDSEVRLAPAEDPYAG